MDKITFKRRGVARSIPIWTRGCAGNAKCGERIVRVCSSTARWSFAGESCAAKLSLVGAVCIVRIAHSTCCLYDSHQCIRTKANGRTLYWRETGRPGVYVLFVCGLCTSFVGCLIVATSDVWALQKKAISDIIGRLDRIGVESNCFLLCVMAAC